MSEPGGTRRCYRVCARRLGCVWVYAETPGKARRMGTDEMSIDRPYEAGAGITVRREPRFDDAPIDYDLLEREYRERCEPTETCLY